MPTSCPFPCRKTDSRINNAEADNNSRENPELPEIREIPDFRENPELLEIRETPDFREAPEIRENPDNPEIRENPDNPEIREIPDVPKTPEYRESLL